MGLDLILHLSSCQVLTVKDKVFVKTSNMFSFLWCLIEGGIFSSKVLMAVSFCSSVTHHVSRVLNLWPYTEIDFSVKIGTVIFHPHSREISVHKVGMCYPGNTLYLPSVHVILWPVRRQPLPNGRLLQLSRLRQINYKHPTYFFIKYVAYFCIHIIFKVP